MSTSTPTPADPDLSEMIDRSFGDGPTPTPPADRLQAGRRALRRRRGAGAVAAAAAVAVVATLTFVALQGTGGPTGGSVPVATTGADPEGTPASEPASEPSPAEEGHGPTDVWMGDGGLFVGSEVSVLATIEDPLGLDHPSFALSVEVAGTEAYYLLDSEDIVVRKRAGRGPGTFEQWLASATTPDGEPLGPRRLRRR